MSDFSNAPGRKMTFGSFQQRRPVDLIDILLCESKRSSQKKLAARLGISPQYLCDVLKGRREISAELASRLGYERVVTFVRWSEQP